MKKILTVLTVFLLMLTLTLSVSAAGYVSYNYNSKGDSVKTPMPYTAVKIISGLDLGIGELSKPGDIYRDYKGNIYICDSGNNRIIILNSDLTLKKVLDTFQDGFFPGEFANPNGVYVDPNTDILYIADTDNSRILGLDQDMKMIIRVDTPYQEGLLEEDFIFAPTKVVVDNGGRIFAVSKNTYEGLMQFNKEGAFLGFVGANKVQISPIDYFWKQLASKAQASKLALTLPTEFSNLEIDDEGFIYTTTSIIAEDSAEILIRRQNPSGDDVLKKSEYLRIAGDIDYANIYGGDNNGPSSFVDVVVGDDGVYSALDAKRGRIFTYDSDGNLLYIFGGNGNNGNDLGTLYTPSSMIKNGDDFVVLDMAKGTLTVFEPTKYGQLINKAAACNYKGSYEEAAEIWSEVIDLNCNYEQAYVGIGISQLRSGEYEEAMKNFKLGSNRYYYSKAFKEYRQDWLEANFVWIVLLLVVVLVLVCVGITRNEKNREANKRKVINNKVKFAFHCVIHPFDGFYEMKYRKMGHLGISSVILVATIFGFVIMKQLTGFILNFNDPNEFNIINEVVTVLGPFLLFCVINWCVTTLMDGEGKFLEIVNVTATSLIPLAISFVPLTLLSNALTQDDAAFYHVFLGIVIAYTAFLLLVAVMEVHQYSFGKTIGSLIITALGMVICIFILLLFVNLINTMFDFLVKVYNEVVMR